MKSQCKNLRGKAWKKNRNNKQRESNKKSSIAHEKHEAQCGRKEEEKKKNKIKL